VSALRTIKFEWKTMLGIAALATGAAVAVYQLFEAWALGIVWTPRTLFGIRFATIGGEPVRFWIAVSCNAVGLIVLSLVLWVIVFDLRQRLRSFHVREMRPPLDDAIRERFDRR
jgi:hypothetical protein